MERYSGNNASRIRLFVPSFFVEQPSLKLPPPVPGTVRPEDVLPQEPPLRFLVPWPSAMPKATSVKGDIVDWGCNPHHPIPCEVNAEVLRQYLEKHPLEKTVEHVFTVAEDPEAVAPVLGSLQNPFATGKDSSAIVWTLDRRLRVDSSMDAEADQKKASRQQSRITSNLDPWSIVSYVSGLPSRPRDSDGETDKTNAFECPVKEQRDFLLECSKGPSHKQPVVRKNIIYNGDGVAVAQVDFGHGTSVGTHVHSLVAHNLEHLPTSFEDHLFHLPTVPWPWMCIPIDERFLLSETAVQSFFEGQPNQGRTSSEILVPTSVKKQINKLAGKLGGADVQKYIQGLPAEANPFAGHFPCENYVSYSLPNTIDWDTYNEPSWRWIAVDVPFEDYSAAAMGLGSRENS